jgi:pimeloyl-ACP methyl ester carboxylesterase
VKITRLIAAGVATVLSLGQATLPAVASTPDAVRADAIHWRLCDGSQLRGAECGSVTVPLDWSAPGGRTIRIAVARVPGSGSPDERIGVLMFNPGGPGSPGLPMLTTVASWLPADVRARFDLVAWDPRGVDQSGPRVDLCPAVGHATPPPTGPVDWAALAASTFDERATDMAGCLTARSSVAPYLGTWFGVRDLDAIRRAVGERQITLWGMSYGTTIGRAYSQQYPSRVRAMVLDGTIDPASTAGSYAREQIAAASTGMARMTAWLGPRSRATLRRVQAALDQRVITAPDGRRVTRWNLADTLLNSIPDQASWPDTRDLLRAFRVALFDRDAGQRERAAELLADAFPANDSSSLDAFAAFVDCADLPGRLTTADASAITAQAADVGGILNGVAAMTAAVTCAGIPADFGRPLPQPATIVLPTPPIIINSIADPRTPWAGARAAANTFTGSVMISYDSAEHISWLRTRSACINDSVTAYVMTKKLPAHDLACSFARAVAP